MKRFPTLKDLKQNWVAIVTQFPLIAAILAPSSVLFDIPALTQHWLSVNERSIPSPTWSTVLSAVSLGFNILANALLVVRFSRTKSWPRLFAVVTRLSAICWLIKTIIEIVNLSYYSHITSQYPISNYQEGFWCSVISTLISGTISFMLMYHWIARKGHKDSAEDNLEDRHFMLSVLSFVSLLALEALVFSRIEDWAYFDGIYFATVSAFTIGFGDFVPTHTSSRILLFPFLLASIALLGQQINIIFGHFSSRSEARRDAWRRTYEQAKQRAHEKAHPQADLQREMEFLRRTRQREDFISNMYDLLNSLLGMVTFWAIGAVLFHYMEGWDYGLSLYFCYIVLLTIGYGDITPHTPAGRVVFVVYAFMAVPVVTSFAVQTISNILSSIDEARVAAQRAKLGLDSHISGGFSEGPPHSGDDGNEFFVSHAEWVAKHHALLEDAVIAPYLRGSGAEDLTRIDDPERRAQVDDVLLDVVLTSALELEAQARSLIIEQLPVSSRAALLLKADRNVQHRDLVLLAKEGIRADGDDDAEDGYSYRPESAFDQLDVLQQVHLYRKTFAALLASASKLKKLHGLEMHKFERRKMNYETKSDSGVADGNSTPQRGPRSDHDAQRRVSQARNTTPLRRRS